MLEEQLIFMKIYTTFLFKKRLEIKKNNKKKRISIGLLLYLYIFLKYIFIVFYETLSIEISSLKNQRKHILLNISQNYHI